MHPGAIFVQLTTGCNAKCISCPHPFTYGEKAVHQKGNMSPAVWSRLLEYVRAAGYRGQIGIYLHHEPLLVRSLFEKIDEVNKTTNAFVVLSTNGALLTDEIGDKLISSPPRQIHININSADPQQYQEMMGLDFETTLQNTKSFIEKARKKIIVEINCPIMPGVDVQRLIDVFPDVKVNTEFWANSRGGLLENVSAAGRNTRFHIDNQCMQPTQNFNVLWDGSVIACCMDWAHESKPDFPNIMDANIFEIYSSPTMSSLQAEFMKGDYRRYKMCDACSSEMGFRKSSAVNNQFALDDNPGQ